MADASIFQQFLQPVKSVADYGADMDRQQLNALQLVGQRRANDTAELQMQQTRGQIADAAAKRNALQALYSNPAITSPKAREDAMLADPLLMQDGMAAQKARLEAEHLGSQTANQNALATKNVAEAGAADYKLRIDKAAKALKDIAGFQSPAEALADLQRNAQAGNVPPEQAQIIAQQLQGITDPQGFATWQQNMRYRILDAKDQLEQDWKSKAEERAKLNDASANNNRDLVPDGRGGWRVNQPLIDAKTRIAAAGAANSVTMGTPLAAMIDGEQVFVQPANRPGAAPTILRVPGASGGTVRPPEKAENLTEGQSKSLLFGTRMQESNKVLGTLANEGVDRPGLIKSTAESVPGLGGALGAVTNGTQTPRQQQVEQAQRDFLNAVLRKESGAAIGAEEFANAAKQYFPSMGDSAEVKAQKLRNRELAIEGMLAEVPTRKRDSITPGAQPAATPASTRGGPTTKPAPKAGNGPSVSNW